MAAAPGQDETPLPVLRAMLAVANRRARPTERGRATVESRRAASEHDLLGMGTVTRRGLGPVSVDYYRVNDAAWVWRYRPGRGLHLGPSQRRLPTHVLVHGGCYWGGTPRGYDPICRAYVRAVGCQVFSVDYRRAPEDPYPAGVEDCYDALAWVATQPGVDLARLSVGGISAGGGLAAAVALMARDRGGPELCLQVLEIPMLDPAMTGESLTTYGSGFGLSRADVAEGWDFYLPDAKRRTEPYASPLTADLAGLPPAFVLTSGCDPLRDEGETYAARLRAAGVPVETYRASGTLHGSTYMTRFLPAARRAVARTTAALRRAYV